MRELASYEDDATLIQIMESSKDGSRFYFEGGALYTHIDGSGRNLLYYVDGMLKLLRRSQDILLLGTAGGALASELHRRGSRVTAVDNCPVTFDIARRWFYLPEQVECVQADAGDFLAATTGKWNAVAIDVFRGFEIPDEALREPVAKSLADVLHPGGLIVWNVAAEVAAASVDRICELLRAAGLRPRRLQVVCPFDGNTFVLCRTSSKPAPAAGR